MSPRHNASQVVDSVNLARTDRAGNDDLKPFRAFLPLEASDGINRGHALMGAAVMTHPYRFGSGYAEIQSSYLEMTTLLQFTKPLMRNKKAARNRHGENPPGVIVLPTQARDAVQKDRVDFLFRREMDEDHHGGLDASLALSFSASRCFW
jgi:hypothetical protein